MSKDNRPEIVLDGDVSPFRRAMREAAQSLNKLGDQGKAAISSLGGPLELLTSRVQGLAAVMSAGGFVALIKGSIDAADNLHDLAQRTGMSVEVLSGLRLVADQSGTSLESLGVAFKRLSVNLVDAAAGNQEMSKIFKGLGISGTDAQAAMYRLSDILSTLPDGAQKTALAVKLLGRSGEEMIPLLNGSGDALRKMIDRGRELAGVTTEMAAEADQLNDQLAELKIQSNAMARSMAKNALPALNDIAAAMREAAKEGGILKAIWVGLGGLGAAMFTDEFSAAEKKIRNLQVEINKLEANKKLVEGGGLLHRWLFGTAESLDAKIRAKMEQIEALKRAMITPPKTPAAPKTSPIDIPDLLGGDKKTKRAAPTDPGHMGTYEARLAEIKNTYEQENVLRQFSKEQELAYWREILATYQVSSQDRLAIAKRTATLELEIRRQSAKEQRDLDAVMVDRRRADALAQIQIEEQQANFARENGALTQRELIALQEEFARRRYEIEYQGALERLELAQTDPTSTPAALAQIKEQMLEIERQYVLRRGELQQQAGVESTTIWRSLSDSISGLWDKGINAIMNGTLTWRNAMRAIGAEMVSWFAAEVVGKQVKEWIAGQTKMLAVKLGFLTQEKAAQIAGSAATTAIKASETTAVVAANATEAATGAAASQASIPFAGPVLAIAAMAAMFAAVMAMGNRKSAARGYDIPKGLNPLTQLHEEEMVLPKKYANLFRAMAAGQSEAGDGGGSGFAPVIQVNAMNSRDVVRALQEGGALNRALRDAYRSFSIKP